MTKTYFGAQRAKRIGQKMNLENQVVHAMKDAGDAKSAAKKTEGSIAEMRLGNSKFIGDI